MKVFITGATGFIGTQVVKRLAQTEHKMICLVRKTSNGDEIQKLGATLIMGDVTDKDSMLKAMEGSDCVINLANVYSFWEPNKQIYTDVNIKGTRNVMECALETGISKVVHISSVVTFGKPADVPFTEASTVGPVHFSKYAQTKYEGDQIAWEFYEKKGLPLVMVFPGTVTGPDDPKSSGQYIKKLINRQMPATVFLDAVLTFVHVKDVAEVIVKATEKEDNIGEKYLACKHQLSFREFNELISEISGVPLPKLTLPNWMAMMNSPLLTGLAAVVKKPPIWDMSMDQMRTLKEGVRADGSKVERELGISYTPIRKTLEETIASFQ